MTQYELAQMARNDQLRMRVEYLMVKAALAQLASQSPSSPTILLGQRILRGTEPLLPWCLGALTNSTIAAGAHALDGSTITAGDLEFAVNSLWSAMEM